MSSLQRITVAVVGLAALTAMAAQTTPSASASGCGPDAVSSEACVSLAAR